MNHVRVFSHLFKFVRLISVSVSECPPNVLIEKKKNFSPVSEACAHNLLTVIVIRFKYRNYCILHG